MFKNASTERHPCGSHKQRHVNTLCRWNAEGHPRNHHVRRSLSGCESDGARRAGFVAHCQGSGIPVGGSVRFGFGGLNWLYTTCLLVRSRAALPLATSAQARRRCHRIDDGWEVVGIPSLGQRFAPARAEITPLLLGETANLFGIRDANSDNAGATAVRSKGCIRLSSRPWRTHQSQPRWRPSFSVLIPIDRAGVQALACHERAVLIQTQPKGCTPTHAVLIQTQPKAVHQLFLFGAQSSGNRPDR